VHNRNSRVAPLSLPFHRGFGALTVAERRKPRRTR
jgi:hypothetical protein